MLVGCLWLGLGLGLGGLVPPMVSNSHSYPQELTYNIADASNLLCSSWLPLAYHLVPVAVEEEVPFSSVFARSDCEIGNSSVDVAAAVKHHADHFLPTPQIQLKQQTGEEGGEEEEGARKAGKSIGKERD